MIKQPHRTEWLRAASTLAVTSLVAVLLIASPPARATGGEGEAYPAFTESDGCSSPALLAPQVAQSGSLSGATVIRGPWGDMFGRTINQVYDSLVWWDVPMSDGESLRVHERMLPALEQVEQNLAAASASGKSYPIRKKYSFAYTARTVGREVRISRHAIGTAIDFNSNTNPYSSSNTLITDMPDWFVDAFRDAGFCWGGDWVTVKDPMHYSWRGPAFTPGYGPALDDYQPLTSSAAFRNVASDRKVPAAPDSVVASLLADVDGNSVLDAVRLVDRAGDLFVDTSRSARRHASCAVERVRIPGGTAEGAAYLFADSTGRGGMDLWTLRDGGGSVSIDVRLDRGLDLAGYGDPSTMSTAVPWSGSARYLTGDADLDGNVDLFVVRDSTLEVWDGASGFSTMLHEVAVDPWSDSTHFSLGDRDRDHRPDLFVIDSGTGAAAIRLGADGYRTVDETMALAFSGSWHDVGVTDYDGDGRDDIQVFTTGNRTQVALGNSSLGLDIEDWFEWSDPDCVWNADPYPYTGWFRDDDGNTHESQIGAIAAIGVTKGCNPPLNDRYCPGIAITRGQLAAFINRMLSLPSAEEDAYIDDEDSIFEDDINRIAATGIAFGCDAPDGNRFCPNRAVRRDEMARFLVRSFNLPPSNVNKFVDDNGSAFEAEINALGAARVTIGCNPPANTRYCPNMFVKRDQMASFFQRALGRVGGG